MADGEPTITFDESAPLTRYDRLFENNGCLPYLGRTDLDLLFDYLLAHSLHSVKLKLLFDRASARGETELFLSSLCRVTSRRGVPVLIVRTKEDGTKLVTDLREGFVTLVFDVKL